LGYEIELSKTVKLLGFFSFIIKTKFFCTEQGCVDCENYRPVRDKKIIEILQLVYNNKRKREDV